MKRFVYEHSKLAELVQIEIEGNQELYAKRQRVLSLSVTLPLSTAVFSPSVSFKNCSQGEKIYHEEICFNIFCSRTYIRVVSVRVAVNNLRPSDLYEKN